MNVGDFDVGEFSYYTCKGGGETEKGNSFLLCDIFLSII